MITDIEIHLNSLPFKRCNEKEQNTAKWYTELSASFAYYEDEYSDICLKISSYWTNPDTVPIEEKEEYIKLVKDLFYKGRARKLFMSGPG